jgi:hypothetical protein
MAREYKFYKKSAQKKYLKRMRKTHYAKPFHIYGVLVGVKKSKRRK